MNIFMDKMSSCSPIPCCKRSDDDPNKRDKCMLGFGYLNGARQIAAAQCFLILGSFVSLVSLGDCAFVKIDEDLRFVLGPTKMSNTFGYLTFEDAWDGRCYWYDDGDASSQDQLKEYWDIMGHDFNLMRVFAIIGAGGGWLQFLLSITLCCSSQVRRLRYLQFFMVSVVLTLFQGATLLVFRSDFCTQYTCTFGRSAGFTGAACACYFMAGVFYLTMSDYPGEELPDGTNGTLDAHSDSQPDPLMDEESAGGPYGRTDAPSYPDSILEEPSSAGTPPASNITKNASNVESPLPSASDNASSFAPSVTSIYIEDGSTATPPHTSNNGEDVSNADPLAAAFTDPTPAQPEVDVVEEDFVDATPGEELIEEIIEEEVVEEYYVHEELSGELETVMEEGERVESQEAGSPTPLATMKTSAQPSEPKGQPLAAPQAPTESPIGKEQRLPQTAEEVVDDSSDDPIFE